MVAIGLGACGGTTSQGSTDTTTHAQRQLNEHNQEFVRAAEAHCRNVWVTGLTPLPSDNGWMKTYKGTMGEPNGTLIGTTDMGGASSITPAELHADHCDGGLQNALASVAVPSAQP
jgi:hypothetical protein